MSEDNYPPRAMPPMGGKRPMPPGGKRPPMPPGAKRPMPPGAKRPMPPGAKRPMPPKRPAPPAPTHGRPVPPPMYNAPAEDEYGYEEIDVDDLEEEDNFEIDEDNDDASHISPPTPSFETAPAPVAPEPVVPRVSVQPDYQNNIAKDLNLPPSFLSTKVIVLLMIVVFAVGFATAKITTPAVKNVDAGLQGVVANPDVPRGRPRCGLTEKSQGCVLYMVNPFREERPAKSFYDYVSSLTDRERYIIETNNMRYGNVKIKPGMIGQFNVPAIQ